MDREAIYNALFTKVSAIPGLKTKSRTLQHWNDVTPSQQPALFQAQGDQIAAPMPGGPTKWTFYVSLYLYCHSTNPKAPPATQLNRLLDAIETALKADLTGYQNLRGLVFDCSIDGKVETDEGLLGSQSIAIIPIKILVVNDDE